MIILGLIIFMILVRITLAVARLHADTAADRFPGDDFRDPDKEVTREIPVETLAEVNKTWREEIARSERPTRNLRPMATASSRATTAVMDVVS